MVREAFLDPITSSESVGLKVEGNINTSRSNSSGPASGSKMYGSAPIPGAVVFDGGTEIATDSGLRMALCPAA